MEYILLYVYTTERWRESFWVLLFRDRRIMRYFVQGITLQGLEELLFQESGTPLVDADALL